MTIIIAAQQQEDLKSLIVNNPLGDHEFVWVPGIDHFRNHQTADGFVDMDGKSLDYSFINGPLLINQTVKCFDEIITSGDNVARFCAWPGFIERDNWEIAVPASGVSSSLQTVLHALDKSYTIVKDSPGLIAPRILSMIINEACYAMQEGTSDEIQIDVAMKLGTNYPEGPFAWGRMIGPQQIIDLLNVLSAKDPRYQPHPFILKYLA